MAAQVFSAQTRTTGAQATAPPGSRGGSALVHTNPTQVTSPPTDGHREGTRPEWKHVERGLMIPDTPHHGDPPNPVDAGPSNRGFPPLTAHRDSRGQSLLLVVIAGTGGPTSDLTSELFYQLWVLLLHLLGKLLATAGEAGPGSTRRPRPLLALPRRTPPTGSATTPWRTRGPTERPGTQCPRSYAHGWAPTPPEPH